MPIEGLPTEGQAQGEGQQSQPNTSDAAVNNTGANQSGAGTQTAQNTGATTSDLTQTPEFKAALTAAIKDKIPQLRRQLAKDISGDKDGEPSVADLQQQLLEEKAARQKAEARQTVRDYLTDPKHKMSLPTDSLNTVVKLVMLDLEYDKDGNPSNLKDAIESVKSSDPRLFTAAPSNINAGAGRDAATGPTNMNDFIRQQHAGRHN